MKRFNKKFLLILLSIIFLVLIFSSGTNQLQTSKKNTNLKNDEQDTTLFNVPRDSADEINITTPENKTYYAPMSGYYHGTYGFENDEDNTFPSEWIEGGTTTGKTTIIASKNGHNKVMLINDNDGNRITPRQDFITEQSSGTVEFWIYFGASNSLQSTGMRIENGTGAILVSIYADGTTNDEWVYNNGTNQVFTGLSAIDEWFHLSIDFSSSGNYKGLSDRTYNFTIRRANRSIYYESQEENYTSNNIGNAATLSITSWQSTERDTWIDAVGYSWDPNYNIGDNFDEGLLLSFENSTTLDWIGYSLDNQANKTILGNSTIPMPELGYHTIKVFANNSIGTNYESDLRGFTVDFIPIPSNRGGDGGDSTKSKAEIFDPTMIVVIGLIVVAAAISLVTAKTYSARKSKVSEKPQKIEEYIKHREEVVEDDIVLSKEKHFCLVHKGPIEGHNFICPTCGAYYCIRCFDAIKDLENACWSCGKSLDPSLPIKSLEEEYDITPIAKKEPKQDSPTKIKINTKSKPKS
ncbi:MAG: hypothetical protein ACFFD2_21190 [Promethearchaeota archaeon]